MLRVFKILKHQGKQYIPDVKNVNLPGIFKGRPIITKTPVDIEKLINLCPVNAIFDNPLSIDIGKCVFCGECSLRFPEKIIFTKDYKLATNIRERLIIKEGDDIEIKVDETKVRKEIRKYFRSSLRLRSVTAGSDNSCEMELIASNNVQFDISRYGIEFVASPRHADGIIITGPINKNMSEALEICYNAIPEPKLIILAGTDAISGGIFKDSPAIDREFIKKHTIDLYVPGNPPHPLTIINGILDLLGR